MLSTSPSEPRRPAAGKTQTTYIGIEAWAGIAVPWKRCVKPGNTHADRSISLLDAALRRRFGFVEMMPDGSVLRDSNVSGIPLRAWFDALNERIRQHVGRDARNLQIGHSYLMQSGSPIKEIASLKRAIRDDIIPLLEEYCYEDYGTLASILGEDLVDVASQRIRHELFDDGQEGLLVQGLLAPCPDISTSSEAISSDESLADEEADEGEDNGANDE